MLPSVMAVFAILSCTSGETPAVQVTLTDKWLQYVKHVGAGWVQDMLEHITFPDISGDVDILIGHVDYTLSGIRITKCDLPEPVVEFYQQPTGLKTSIVGLSAALVGGWSTHFGLIHDGGSFDMAILSVSLTSVVQLGRDPEGHLSITSISCESQVGDVDIQFHGGASFIFQPFVDHFKGKIVGIIQSNICPNVQKAIDGVESHLKAMSVSYNVNEVLTVEFPLTGPPAISGADVNLGLKGEFYSIKTHQEPPFVAQPFVLPEQPDYMMSVGLSEFTLNSASFGYFSAGKFQVLINESMVPPKSPVHLNTTSMGMFIPQLPKQYPNMLMTLQVYATEAPMVSLQPDVGEVSAQFGAKAFAIEPNGTQVPLFTLNIETKLRSKMWIADGKLKGNAVLDNFTLTLASSEVGTFKTDALENVVKVGINLLGLPKLNALLGDGIFLPPMKQAQLVDPVLKVEKGFLAVSADMKIVQTSRNFNTL
uniref:Bactericidal permeability-increasing protein n=2 Tax=Iconisemion striatum TaxID=60296 RepID=A0A1A7XN72_9TELE